VSTIVVGGGIAGTAAAIVAAQGGDDVILVDGGTGASTLAPGAIDVAPWERARAVDSVSDEARRVLAALDAFDLPIDGARVATMAGIVRRARGIDRALLDLAHLGDGDVLVVRSDRWDAPALARSWSASGGRSFVELDAVVARHVDERVLPAADFAARHDDPERLAWLAERLREGLTRVDAARPAAVILPPMLGVARSRAAALSALVGVPCGEATGLPGGPSGLRFEAARDRALAAAEVVVAAGRVVRVEYQAGEWRVERDDGAVSLTASRVVLAAGGVLGGGIAYTPSDAVFASAVPSRARATFVETIAGPLVVGAHGKPLPLPGSLSGVPSESLAWPFSRDPLLERVGILTDDDGRVAGAPPGLFAAGELVADRARTWLASLESGVRAGDAP
jgi:glycerol-3-phosphate dehydrogenase subunit B